jgi:hypothetical protein
VPGFYEVMMAQVEAVKRPLSSLLSQDEYSEV